MLAVLCICGTIIGQERFVSVPLAKSGGAAGKKIGEHFIWEFAPIDLTYDAPQPFVAVNMVWELKDAALSGSITFEISHRDTEDEWTPWTSFEVDSHLGNGHDRFVSIQKFLPDKTPAIRIRAMSIDSSLNNLMEMLQVHFFYPGMSEVPEKDMPTLPLLRGTHCDCPRPGWQTRSQWCPSGNCFPHPNPEFTSIAHMVIHHSAGTNVSNDWAAIVRSIWSLHVNSNGWSDIGYNWLIDPNGVIYEGRGEDILGAHFCGLNSGTSGTCVMGDFTAIKPQVQAVQSLSKLFVWLGCERDLHPDGIQYHPSSQKNLGHVIGHRDGCNTSCPGNAFYPMLQSVRDSIAQLIRGGHCTCQIDTPQAMVSETSEGVQVDWSSIAGSDVHYTIWRKSEGDLEFVAIGTKNDPPFEDKTVMSNLTYEYCVSANDGWCESLCSDPRSITTRPGEYFILEPQMTNNVVRLLVRNQDPRPVSLDWFGIDGRLMMRQELSKPGVDLLYMIDTSLLSNGMYFVEAKQGNQRALFKVLKY